MSCLSGAEVVGAFGLAASVGGELVGRDGLAYEPEEPDSALDIVARVRMAHDPATRAYVERRTVEGRTSREIKRTLKRYIARQLTANSPPR